MPVTAHAAVAPSRTDGHDGKLLASLAGVVAASVMPSLFWVALIAAAGNVLGFVIPASALVATGAAISLFLAAVCAPLMLRAG